MKSTKQILIEARELIDTPDKWYQGGAHDPKNPSCMCLWSAALKVGNPSIVCNAIYKAKHPIKDFLKKTFSGSYNREAVIIYFNDHPSTTHADIMNLFDKAIQAADGE